MLLKKRVLVVIFGLLLSAAAASAQLETSYSGNGNPCLNPQQTLVSIAINASTTSAVQLIALSAGKHIYVCSMTIQAGGTSPTFSLVYGTGTNCATGQTVLVQAMSLPTTSATPFALPVALTPTGQALCTLLAGTSPTAVGVMTYIQI